MTDNRGIVTGDTAELADFLQLYPRLLMLTGAGISTASGIPDYRDRNGVRRGKAPLHGPDFRRSETVRRRYWVRSMAGWPTLASARPNAAHHAIASLEANGIIDAVVTQNVDGLHRHAGSARVVEMHGNIHSVVCLACGTRFPRKHIQEVLEQANPALAGTIAAPAPDGDAHLEPAHFADYIADFRLPSCMACDGMLQPDVVFFGDGVPAAVTLEAERLLQDVDALLVAGSSLMVFSSFRLCKLAAEWGKPIAAINIGVTRADPILSFKTEEPAEQALPLLARLLSAR